MVTETSHYLSAGGSIRNYSFIEISVENNQNNIHWSGAYWGGGFKPPPEIPKVLQNRAKLNPIVKTVKNCWI